MNHILRECEVIAELQAKVKARSMRYQADRKDDVAAMMRDMGLDVIGPDLDLPYAQWCDIDRYFTAFERIAD